jgi:Rrf2 family protein
MVVTKASDYGVFGVIYLAKQPKGRIVSLSEISEAEDIPKRFLAKIFMSLARSGLLVSHRGAGGGFSLARPANKITVKELLESIQGPIYLTKCLSGFYDCPRIEICRLRELLEKAQDNVTKILTKNTLADLIK